MKLYIDNQLIVAHEIDGLDALTWSEQESTDGLERKVSGELDLIGEAYEFIKTHIIDNPIGLSAILSVKIVEDCCNKEVLGQITAEGIRWCDNECKVHVTITERADQLTCFKSTWIADDWNDFQANIYHPKVSYCIEMRPNFLQDLLIIIGIIFNIWELLQIPVIAIISLLVQAVCFFVNLFGGNCPAELSNGILDDFIAQKKAMNKLIIGCGRKQPSPYVREYIINACLKCGIGFNSSIFNDANSLYNDTVLFFAPAKKGYFSPPEAVSPLIPDNIPYWTLEDLMNYLKPVFNAEYRLRNGVLYFERKDKITGTVMYDFTSIDKNKLQGGVCYKWNGIRRPAFINIEYQKDAVDYVGNEARDRYNEIVDFNKPVVNPAFSGERKVTFEFAPSRFRNDGIERDVLTSYQNSPFFGNIIKQYDDVLLMAQNSTFLPKLLIFDTGTSINDARIKQYPLPSGWFTQHPSEEAPPPRLYNYPYFVDANLSIGGSENLWEFHKIDDSRVVTTKNYNFELTMKYNCDDILLLNNLIGSAVILGMGTGMIQGWTVNFGLGTINLTGTV